MDPKFKEIIDGLPDKPPRSRLEPYYELVKELRRRGRTYRDIADILAEECQLRVTASGIHAFVRTRSQAKRRLGKRRNSRKDEQRVTSAIRRLKTATPNSASAPSSGDEVARKMAALKARRPDAKPTSEPFHFDENEPLRLDKPEKRRKSE
jgi:seryl-tRNA synthetase